LKKQNWAEMGQEQPGSAASQLSQQGFCTSRLQGAKESREKHSEINKQGEPRQTQKQTKQPGNRNKDGRQATQSKTLPGNGHGLKTMMPMHK